MSAIAPATTLGDPRMSTLGAAAAQSTSFVQATQQAFTSGAQAAGNARVATAFEAHAHMPQIATGDVLAAVRGRDQLAQAATEEPTAGAAADQVAATYARWSSGR